MPLETEIISHLALMNVVGSRVYGAQLPQAATMPAITIHRISTIPLYTHQGRAGMKSRIQVTVYADTWQSSLTTTSAMRTAMDTFSMPGARCRLLLGIDIGREQNSTLYMQMQDFEIIHPPD